jgi:L-rhamnose mutarotase
MNTRRYCMALDLKDDPQIIEEYEYYHRPDVIWPEIKQGISACNILKMDIFRAGNRLFMIMETNEVFDLKRDFERMAQLPRQPEWAALMRSFQQPLPFARHDEHWLLMDQIFGLNDMPEK